MADLSVSMRNASFLCTTCVKYHVICSDERNVNIAIRVLAGPDVAGHDTAFSTHFAVGMHSLCDARMLSSMEACASYCRNKSNGWYLSGL
jgi:hypothetical protein